ncbi:uncharacterized protein METZ01_LOCUS306138, partial [marine metagenome]
MALFLHLGLVSSVFQLIVFASLELLSQVKVHGERDNCSWNVISLRVLSA